ALSPCPTQKSLILRCGAVLNEMFIVQAKQQNTGHTGCMACVFCEAWAGNSRSKPDLSLICAPFGSFFRMLSAAVRSSPAALRGRKTQYTVCFFAIPDTYCDFVEKSRTIFGRNCRKGLESAVHNGYNTIKNEKTIII
ncbi:MAG: hypothetical protein J5940_03960, partial [Clostridia bacterium]|nr:hypothetical protein [Clostridia bacterium]